MVGDLAAVGGVFAGVGGGGADELAEERLGPVRARVELGVELGGDEEGVVGQLDHLDQALVGRGAAGDQALVLELAPQEHVHLVTVTVALVDDALAEDLPRPRALVQFHRVGAEPHRAAHVAQFFLFGQQVDHRVGRLGIELGGVGAVHPGDVAGELDHRDLHAEADAEVGDLALAGDPRGLDLALDPALAEAAGDQDPVEALERVEVEVLGVDQLDLHVDAVVDAAVLERLDHRLVGVLELHVLADDRDPDLAGRRVGAPHHRLPLAQVGRGRLHVEVVEHQVVDALGAVAERHLVDVVDVVGGDHRVDREAREERDLLADLAVEPPFGAAEQRVRLDPDAAQLVDRVLGRLRLQLAGVADVRAPASGGRTSPASGRGRCRAGGSPRGTAATRCRRPCRRSR